MLRGVLVRIGLMAGVLALLAGGALAPVSAQEAPTFAIPGNERLQTLSPDGSMIATTTPGGGDLCVFTVPAADQIACVNLRELRINIDHTAISWSPDGSALVFSERAAQYLIDSDIWLFDVESAALTNLTDDGLEGGLPFIRDEPVDPPFLVDLVPTWSPDGASIAFSRFEFTGDSDNPTSMMLLDVASGDVTEVAVFNGSTPFALPYRLGWSPDGETVFATGSSPDLENEINGVWAVDVERGDFTKLVGTSDAFNGAAPALTAVSPAGDALIISYPAFIWGTRTPDDGSGYALLNLVSGDVTPIEPSDKYSGDYTVVVGPNFSPDGSALIFGIRQPTVPAGFVIARDIASGDEIDLADLPDRMFPIASDPMVPVQVGGSVALVLTDLTTGVLVELPADISDAPAPAATPEADDAETAATPESDDASSEAAVTPEPEDVPLTVTIAANAAVLREGPSTDDAIIVVLKPGTELEALGEAFESDDHFWIEVMVIDTGDTGFVRTDFLEPVG